MGLPDIRTQGTKTLEESEVDDERAVPPSTIYAGLAWFADYNVEFGAWLETVHGRCMPSYSSLKAVKAHANRRELPERTTE